MLVADVMKILIGAPDILHSQEHKVLLSPVFGSSLCSTELLHQFLMLLKDRQHTAEDRGDEEGQSGQTR